MLSPSASSRRASVRLYKPTEREKSFGRRTLKIPATLKFELRGRRHIPVLWSWPCNLDRVGWPWLCHCIQLGIIGASAVIPTFGARSLTVLLGWWRSFPGFRRLPPNRLAAMGLRGRISLNSPKARRASYSQNTFASHGFPRPVQQARNSENQKPQVSG